MKSPFHKRVALWVVVAHSCVAGTCAITAIVDTGVRTEDSSSRTTSATKDVLTPTAPAQPLPHKAAPKD